MKKILKGTLLIVLLPLLLTSCEQMFTYSMFEWAQRDPSNLSEAQQVSYAQNVLGTGDQQTMADAYEAIKDNEEPEVQLLASKLAVGASGINEAVEQALSDLESGSTGSLESYLDSIDSTMLDNAVKSMTAAADDIATASEVTSEEYLTVAAAGLISAVQTNEAGADDFETAINSVDNTVTPDKNGTWSQQARYYFDQSGYTIDDLDSMLNYS